MTLTQIKGNPHIPVEGHRSRGYVGIELLFDQRFFGLTSDCGTEFRADPRFKATNRAFHLRLKEMLFEAGSKTGARASEIQGEWESLVRRATIECTRHFSEQTGIRGLQVVGYTKENERKLRASLSRALAWLETEIRLRTREFMRASAELPFSDSTTRIYVHMQNLHSKERDGMKVYKIGKTTRPHQRKGAHRTSNTDTTDVCSFPERGIVKEANIHRLFAPPLDGEREWFLLSQEQVEILKCPFRLEKEIRKMLEETK